MRWYPRRRRSLLLVIAVCLLISAGISLADNTLVVNPYAEVDWDQFTQQRANLHTHTTQSDGSMAPAQVIDEYHERGYSILALTDHNRNTWPWQDFGREPAELGMLAISGNELSRHHHTGALFCELETEKTDHEAALKEVAALDGLAILYHPGRYWKPEEDAPNIVSAAVVKKYAGIFSRHDHLVGMEFVNGGNRYPHDRLLWDALLSEMMPERPVHGFADDDMHGMSRLGNDWTVFPLPELTEDGVRNALTTGAFYAASVSTHPADDRSVDGTPVITRISHDEEAGTLTVEATVAGEPSGDEAYRWIADGNVVHVGPTLRYRDDESIGSYARLEVLGTGGTAFTNAFGFVDEAGGDTADNALDPAPEGTFTVVVIPDTQDYADGGAVSFTVSIAQIAKPAETIILGETQAEWSYTIGDPDRWMSGGTPDTDNWNYKAQMAAMVHNGGRNLTWCDGHAKWMHPNNHMYSDELWDLE